MGGPEWSVAAVMDSSRSEEGKADDQGEEEGLAEH